MRTGRNFCLTCTNTHHPVTFSSKSPESWDTEDSSLNRFWFQYSSFTRYAYISSQTQTQYFSSPVVLTLSLKLFSTHVYQILKQIQKIILYLRSSPFHFFSSLHTIIHLVAAISYLPVTIMDTINDEPEETIPIKQINNAAVVHPFHTQVLRI